MIPVLFYRLALDHPRRDSFHGQRLRGANRSLSIQRLAERRHHPAQQFVSHGYFDDASGPPDLVAFLNCRVVPEEDAADIVLFQVECHAHDVIGERHQFAGLRVAQPMNARHAIAHLQHGSGFVNVNIPIGLQNLLLENIGDFIGTNL